MSKKFPIPVAAFKPAANEWKAPEATGLFEQIFDSNEPRLRKRRMDPTNYVFHRERTTKSATPCQH